MLNDIMTVVPSRDIQVLVPMREQGVANAKEINRHLQKALLPNALSTGIRNSRGEEFYLGDKVRRCMVQLMRKAIWIIFFFSME